MLPIDQFADTIDGMKAINLDGTDFAGSFNAGVGADILNAPSGTAAFFSQTTPYSAGTARIDIKSDADNPQMVIAIKGMDDQRGAKTPMQIALNGTVIWSGPSPFPNADWAIYGIAVNDPSLIRQTGNQLTIINSTNEGRLPQTPWFAIQAVSVYYQ